MIITNLFMLYDRGCLTESLLVVEWLALWCIWIWETEENVYMTKDVYHNVHINFMYLICEIEHYAMEYQCWICHLQSLCSPVTCLLYLVMSICAKWCHLFNIMYYVTLQSTIWMQLLLQLRQAKGPEVSLEHPRILMSSAYCKSTKFYSLPDE